MRLLAIALLIIGLGAFTVNAMNAPFLVGSRNSHIYPLDTCDAAKRIKPGNVIIFASPQKAKEAGYRPCKICNPPETTTKIKEA